MVYKPGDNKKKTVEEGRASRGLCKKNIKIIWAGY